MASSAYLVLRQLLATRLERKSRSWLKAISREIADGLPDARFAGLVSQASRHARQRTPLEPSEDERAAVARAVDGVEIERWTLLETLRVALLLSRSDLAEESGALAIEEIFRYADEGEACALYRTLAFLPAGARFLSRAREGCRTNLLTVFEAAALDTPYPREHFDELAWNQAAVKAVFLGAPLWRMVGLDGRLNPELARMALDLVEERTSAGRPIQPQLWLLLGEHGGERGLAALEHELRPENDERLARRAAALGLARAGATERLADWKEIEQDREVAATMEAALAGETDRTAFAPLCP